MKLLKINLILILSSIALFSSCGENVNHVPKTTQDQFIDVVPQFNEPTVNWGLEAINFEQSKSSKQVIVAVIDTGLDTDHQDIKANVWSSSENDSFGDNTDTVGHGTHVSGIISSMCDKVSIMSLKYTDFDSSLKAIRYAIDHGADVINYSGGGNGSSYQEYSLFKEAQDKGIILVAAAGNDGQDIGEVPYYPAAYGLSNIISVGATDQNSSLINESNYGHGVDVAAPGLDIYSSLPGNRHGFLSGTSQAAAFVSGTVALLKSNAPQLKANEIKSILISTSKHNPSLQGKVRSEGVIDVANALSSVQ